MRTFVLLFPLLGLDGGRLGVVRWAAVLLLVVGLLWALVLTLLYMALRRGEGAMGLGLAPERAEE